MNYYILTGTPGSGKTTLINRLSQLGYYTAPEAATHIISEQQSLGISQPWTRPNFIDLILQQQVHDYTSSPRNQSVFFDRSPICTYALCQFLNLQPPIDLLTMIENATYQKTVFFIENIGSIKNTHARTISYEDALIFEKIHRVAYTHFGYRLINIPNTSVEARLQLILDQA